MAEAKIFNKICPDIILANSRIAKLNTLALYEINSIITKNGVIAVGAPFGKKILKNFNPWILNPVILIWIKALTEKKKVKIIELVIVKENGTKPSKLEKKIIKKIKYI